MFATHPRTPDRVLRAAENAAAAGTAAGRIGRDDYLRRIDGMVYGDDPSQGFVRGRQFVHPKLRFAFEAPAGYRLQNTPSAVVGGDSQGNGLKFDAAAMRSTNMRDYIAKEWAKELKIQSLRQINSFEVDGRPAASAGTSGKTKDGKTVDVGLAAIQVGPGQVYRFMFLSQGGASEAEARAAKETVESFRLLSEAEAARFQPKRIEIAKVGAGDGTAAFARRMAVDDLPELQFEVLNGLDQGEQPASGSLVKLITE
jgi:predicted Zn-dependent protease